MNVCHEFYIIKVCKLFCLAIFVVDFVGDKVNYSFFMFFSFILTILLKFIINCSAIYAAAAVKIKLNKLFIKY